jgi:hypothetical protein
MDDLSCDGVYYWISNAIKSQKDIENRNGQIKTN